MAKIFEHFDKLHRIRLGAGDRDDITAVMNDRFQSTRARKRAKALLLIEDGTEPVAVHMRTGLTLIAQDEMHTRLATHGIQAAIFGSPRKPEQRRYDVEHIKKVLNDCLASRPPAGNVYWNLEHLTEVVRERVGGAESISRQSVGNVLRKELGIRSIRSVEPYWLKCIAMAHGRLAKAS